MRQIVAFLLLVVSSSGFYQSALEVQLGPKAATFEHWYYSSLPGFSPRLEFFNYTYAIWHRVEGRENSSVVNPFFGYNLYKGIGISASITFQNEVVSPFLGLQYSKTSRIQSLFAALSYTTTQSGMGELFLWYLFQPSKEGWKPFGQFHGVSNWGARHNFTQLKIRVGPSYKSHSFGLAWDTDWDGLWNSFTHAGLFYRIQLQ